MGAVVLAWKTWQRRPSDEDAVHNEEKAMSERSHMFCMLLMS